MNPHPNSAEISRLVGELVDGQATPRQHARLVELLRDDDDARRLYADLIALHALLETELDRHLPDVVLRPALPTLAPPALPQPTGQRTRSPLLGFLDKLPAAIQPARHPVRFLAVAALLTSLFWGALMWNVWPRGGGAPAGVARQDWRPIPFIARLTHAEEVVWNEGAEQFRPGAYLAAGQRLELESGRLQILFGDGARVAVAGPASLRIDSRKGLALDAGRALARVTGGAAARGFRVETPHAELIDLGTEFGVEVRKGEMEVHVFEGKVEVLRADDPRDRGRRLAAGEAAVFGSSPQQGFYVKEKKMNRAIYLSLAAVLTLSVADVARAVPIVPESYAQTAGPAPHGDFPDEGGVTLTDGLLTDGVNAGDVYVNLAWVGYQDVGSDEGTAQPEITFDFGAVIDFSSTTIHYLSHPVVGAPDVVNIRFSDDDVTYSPTPDVTFTGFLNPTQAALSATIDLTGNSGRYVRFEFLNDAEWTFLSEFSFEMVPPPVPEPTTGAILGAGGLMLWGALRRRRNR